MIDTRVPTLPLIYKLLNAAIYEIQNREYEEAIESLDMAKRTLEDIADV
jgi:hypothetical protein